MFLLFFLLLFVVRWWENYDIHFRCFVISPSARRKSDTESENRIFFSFKSITIYIVFGKGHLIFFHEIIYTRPYCKLKRFEADDRFVHTILKYRFIWWRHLLRMYMVFPRISIKYIHNIIFPHIQCIPVVNVLLSSKKNNKFQYLNFPFYVLSLEILQKMVFWPKFVAMCEKVRLADAKSFIGRFWKCL